MRRPLKKYCRHLNKQSSLKRGANNHHLPHKFLLPIPGLRAVWTISSGQCPFVVGTLLAAVNNSVASAHVLCRSVSDPLRVEREPIFAFVGHSLGLSERIPRTCPCPRLTKR
ncbi:hypothetical protein CEXT_577281 [Caerostris extrusa]|uniref:Uncharacterized protein n=1 Tax=Caerostris extrusa TaxID=172846 RepID=A0AAV4PMX6_CAEEX|nr:hypothetical protein CEXT_577281 [Caerostris extrusa]